MFNYHAIDKHITLETLFLIVSWFQEHRPQFAHHMVTGVERQGNDYQVHLSTAGSGHTEHFRVEDGELTRLPASGVWMS
jgi:hypothetical protein